MNLKKLTATAVVLSFFGLPAICASNFSVTTQAAPQTAYQNQYASQQYTQVPYQPQQQTTSANQPLQGYVISVPAGVNIPVTTTFELSSSTLTLGQSVSMVLTNGFYYNNVCIAPAGSTVTGNVIYVRKGGHAGKNGQLQLRFTQINTPYGSIIPISAMIKTTDGTGLLKAGTASSSDEMKSASVIPYFSKRILRIFSLTASLVSSSRNGIEPMRRLRSSPFISLVAVRVICSVAR